MLHPRVDHMPGIPNAYYLSKDMKIVNAKQDNVAMQLYIRPGLHNDRLQHCISMATFKYGPKG